MDWWLPVGSRGSLVPGSPVLGSTVYTNPSGTIARMLVEPIRLLCTFYGETNNNYNILTCAVSL